MVNVLTVGAGVGEFLQTFLTLVRLLSAVKSLVFYEVMLVFESFVAAITLVWPVFCRIINQNFGQMLVVLRSYLSYH